MAGVWREWEPYRHTAALENDLTARVTLLNLAADYFSKILSNEVTIHRANSFYALNKQKSDTF